LGRSGNGLQAKLTQIVRQCEFEFTCIVLLLFYLYIPPMAGNYVYLDCERCPHRKMIQDPELVQEIMALPIPYDRFRCTQAARVPEVV
jgi:hypothetical protein